MSCSALARISMSTSSLASESSPSLRFSTAPPSAQNARMSSSSDVSATMPCSRSAPQGRGQQGRGKTVGVADTGSSDESGALNDGPTMALVEEHLAAMAMDMGQVSLDDELTVATRRWWNVSRWLHRMLICLLLLPCRPRSSSTDDQHMSTSWRLATCHQYHGTPLHPRSEAHVAPLSSYAFIFTRLGAG